MPAAAVVVKHLHDGRAATYPIGSMTTYFVLMYVVSLGLSFTMAFYRATLRIGRLLSDTDSLRGFQDAVTPPASTNVTLLIWAVCLGGVAYGVWAFGWLVGLLTGVALFVVASFQSALFFPKADSPLLVGIIERSMMNRYADYLANNDHLRASMMEELLERLGQRTKLRANDGADRTN